MYKPLKKPIILKNKSIIIFEQSEIIKAGLEEIINGQPEKFLLIKQDANSNIIDQIAEHKPNIIIINPNLLPSGSYDKLKQLIDPEIETKLLGIIYAYYDENTIKLFDDVIYINDPIEQILEKIEDITKTKQEKETEKTGIKLSEREIDVLKHLVKGLSNKEISDQLFISPHTVISHRKNITHKLGIKSLSGLTIYAVLNEIVDKSELESYLSNNES